MLPWGSAPPKRLKNTDIDRQYTVQDNTGCLDCLRAECYSRHRGNMPPLFKDLGKVPLSCNLVALLEGFEDTKTASKIQVSSYFRGSTFQNFPVELPPDTLHFLQSHSRTSSLFSTNNILFSLIIEYRSDDVIKIYF